VARQHVRALEDLHEISRELALVQVSCRKAVSEHKEMGLDRVVEYRKAEMDDGVCTFAVTI
jgi:hypothetical protein